MSEQAWTEFDRNTPEAFWDIAMWTNDGHGWTTGSLDVADRKRIVVAVLDRIAATTVKPDPESRTEDPA